MKAAVIMGVAAALAALGLAPALAWAEAPAPAPPLQLAGLFADHMVLPRDQPFPVWGTAAPGQRVEVSFRGARRSAVADRAGRFSVAMPAAKAGGPDRLDVAVGGRAALTLRDVLVGELWLCAGQSNMEWALRDTVDGPSVAEAQQGELRQFKVSHRTSLVPRDDLAPAPWVSASPERAGEFSAVGFHFASALRSALHTPVGLINASWGGTGLEAWMSPEQAARTAGLQATMRQLPPDEATALRQHVQQMTDIAQRWGRGALPAQPFEPAALAALPMDAAGWRPLNAPSLWEAQGLGGFDGVVWYRREVQLTALQAQAKAKARLSLGKIDDCDETYVNGVRLGGQCQWDAPRQYAVPPGLLKAGRNLIAVRVTDTGGGGGFHGRPEDLALDLAAEAGPERVELAGPWQARVESVYQPEQLGPNDHPTLLFNGMVRSLLPMPVSGVLWYQGESNVAQAARYAADFPELITDWRRQWRQPGLPFYFVQLSAFNPTPGEGSPATSTWAELRAAQATALRLPRTGMAVTIDVGDAADIHPRRKRPVGQRLAAMVLHDLHGAGATGRAPAPYGLQRQGAALWVAFAGGALAPPGPAPGAALAGFEIAAVDGRYQPAQARLDGGLLKLTAAGVVRPVAVRYAWADNPAEANLKGANGLPVAPFRLGPRLGRPAAP